MRRSFLMVVVLGAVGVALAENGKTKLSIEFTPAATRGESIYLTYCHHCHGPTGDGTGHIGHGLPMKPVDLTRVDVGPKLTEGYIFKIVKEGMKANGGTLFMISWREVLRDEEIKDVAKYTAKLAAEGRAKRGAK